MSGPIFMIPTSSLMDALDFLSWRFAPVDILAQGDFDQARVRVRNRRTYGPAVCEVEKVSQQTDGSIDLFVAGLNIVSSLGVASSELLREIEAANRLDEADRLLHRLVHALQRVRHACRRFGPGYLAALTRLGMPEDLPPRWRPLGLFFARPRTTAGLARLLQLRLGAPVRVRALSGGWEIWRQAIHWNVARACRIVIGPLDRDGFERFLPGQAGLRETLCLARYYLGALVRFELELILTGADVRAIEHFDRGDVFAPVPNLADRTARLTREMCAVEEERMVRP